MTTDARRLLIVGWDASASSLDALKLARLLARECGLSMSIVHCYPGHERFPEALGMIEEILGDAHRKLDELPADALESGSTRDLVIAISPSEGLLYEAERADAEMIVVGSTHHGALGRLHPGAVAENLLHGAPCAVTLAPAGYADSGIDSIRMVATAFDGSDESRAAVDEAVRLAQEAGAGLKVIAVAPSTPFGWPGLAYSYEELHQADRESRREMLAELVASLPHAVRPQERFLDGDAATEIVAECEKGVDLLVLGSRGYGALRRAMLGSVSTPVMRTASCPVVIVPHDARSVRRLHDRAAEKAGAGAAGGA